MLCEEVSLLLANAMDKIRVLESEDGDGQLPGVELLGLPAAHHLEKCLRCQAEFVHYRRLGRNLRQLRHEVMDPDPDLLNEILDSVRPPATVHQLHRGRERRRAYIGSIAAAATAGAAGAIVWASKAVNRAS